LTTGRAFTVKDFEALYKEFTEHERAILGFKRSEYADPQGDVLRNFREVSALLDQADTQYCLTLLAKHFQGIVNAVLRASKGGKIDWRWQDNQGQEAFKQRIADTRNYLLLLAACIEDRERQERELEMLMVSGVAAEPPSRPEEAGSGLRGD
jgi:hypothetical protein